MNFFTFLIIFLWNFILHPPELLSFQTSSLSAKHTSFLSNLLFLSNPLSFQCFKHLCVAVCLVMRLGNSAESLEAAKRAVHLSDCVLRLCITVSHLNRAMYFACDNLLWAGKTGLLPRLDQNKWSQRSFRSDHFISLLLPPFFFSSIHSLVLCFFVGITCSR